MANPAGTVQAYWRALPQNRPPEVNEATAREQQHILEVGLRDMRVEDRPDRRWGWNDPAGLRALQTFLVANGARQTLVPDDQLFSNALVDEYNRFDAAAIRARADSYRP
jgi:hypothetical protein